jgi:hypothetical protein
VLHFHVDMLHYPFLHSFVDRTVTTLHGRLDLAELRPLYSTYRHTPLVSISNNQRAPMPPVSQPGGQRVSWAAAWLAALYGQAA